VTDRVNPRHGFSSPKETPAKERRYYFDFPFCSTLLGSGGSLKPELSQVSLGQIRKSTLKSIEALKPVLAIQANGVYL